MGWAYGIDLRQRVVDAIVFANGLLTRLRVACLTARRRNGFVLQSLRRATGTVCGVRRDRRHQASKASRLVLSSILLKRRSWPWLPRPRTSPFTR